MTALPVLLGVAARDLPCVVCAAAALAGLMAALVAMGGEDG